jgi:hypothetical protein
MTAALGNTAQGTPFATGVDAFVYPQFIGYALRAPTTQDIYNPGTRWQNNAVNPPVDYYTVGAGLWYQMPSSTFGVSSVAGTTNQITASPTVGAVVLSVPATFVAPGSIASTTTLSSGTSITAATTITAGTGITSSLGNITSSEGNLILNGINSKIDINATAPSTASIGTSAAMTAGTITISTTAITAVSKVFVSANTAGGTVGVLNAPIASYVIGTSFVINSSSATDTSTVNWWIIN